MGDFSTRDFHWWRWSPLVAGENTKPGDQVSRTPDLSALTLERFDHDENDDRKQQYGRDFIEGAVPAGGVTVAIGAEGGQ
jgi:hypothetical protein